MVPTAKIPVILVDDHTLVRRGLRAILESDPEIALLGEATDGWMAVREARDLGAGVVVMDISLPRLNGIDATRQIAIEAPAVRVLILSMHDDEIHVREALSAGAKGYLVKDAADVELIWAVKSMARYGSYFSPSVQRLLVTASLRRRAADDAGDVLWRLTPREREIVQLIAEGRSKLQIARLLLVSPETVESHRKHVMKKLGARNVAEIVRFALRSGIVC